MRDLDTQAAQVKDSSNPLSSEAMTDDVTVFALDHAVVDAHKGATVAAYGHAQVEADDNATIFAHEKSVVIAHGMGIVRAYDKASVTASDSVKVYDVHLKGKSDSHHITLGPTAKLHEISLFTKGENWLHEGEAESHGDATIVHVDGNAKLTAYDQSTGLLTDKASAEGWDHARLDARDHAVVVGLQNTQIHAYDETEIHAHDAPTVWAHGHAWVAGNDSAKIYAYDNTEVHARDSMAKFGGHIEAYGHSAILRDRYFAGPPGIGYTLHDQSQFEDRDADDKVISIKHAGDK